MAITVKDGFYCEKKTNRIFFVKNGLIPPWVKSKPFEWEPLKKEEKIVQFNSHDFEEIYSEIEVDVNKLGCVMLDVSGKSIPMVPDKDDLYYSEDKEKFWIKGFVAGKNPHVTLLYGLMKPASEWEKQINEILSSWKMEEVSVDHVGFFESNLKNEPYYCIIAHIEKTPKLLEGHKRLELLPHINTFSEYDPHITIAYIKKDEKKRDAIVTYYNRILKGKQFPVLNINLGKEK